MSVSTTRALRASAMLIAALGVQSTQAQIAKGANKFLGNITVGNQVRSDFLNFWNQITAENECKWGSIEGGRDQMSWDGCDRAYNFAKKNQIPFRFHTLVWGSQYPGDPGTASERPTAGWLMKLSASERKAEVEEWIEAVAKKYPDAEMIDVVNEAHPNHAPAPFKDALGGDGASGYDWIVNSFKLARKHWPKAILVYNDYNTIEYGDQVDWCVNMLKAIIKAGAPIDAVGAQAHDAFKVNTNTVKSNIDKLASTGLPVYITEYDIELDDDAQQKKVMEEQFTMFWNHPKVVGVTYWGYVCGQTWRKGPSGNKGTCIMNSNGAERPALTWLKDYVGKNPGPKPPPVGPNVSVGLSAGKVSVTNHPGMVMRNIDGRMVMGVEHNGAFQEVSALGRN